MFYVHTQLFQHAQYALFSMHMPIVWDGLSIPTEGCSVCMPIIITNSMLRSFEQTSVPYMMKVILTNISVECGVVVGLLQEWENLEINDSEL